MNRNSGSNIPPAKEKISRVDYSKHPHARLIGFSVVALFVLVIIII